jgi:hypothetical protein
MTGLEVRPPIPVTCAHRPVVGGLVAPFINVMLADGGCDFRTPHHATYERCWREGLCQTCGLRLTRPAVLFGGPNQLRDLHFDEPPLCAPCAIYASRACPMVSGRMERYATRQRVSEGRRGHVCADAGCGCGGFRETDPSVPGVGGDPAHPWYAVYARPGGWLLTGKTITTRCSDKGCEHERFILSGAYLDLSSLLKVVLVSEPGTGRTWRTLAPDEAAVLLPDGRSRP